MIMYCLTELSKARILHFQLGRINLLTPARVKLASSEIRLGEMIPLKSVHVNERFRTLLNMLKPSLRRSESSCVS